MIASAASNPIFDIKATEDKNNISTPTFGSVSGKNVLSFGSLEASIDVNYQVITLFLWW